MKFKFKIPTLERLVKPLKFWEIILFTYKEACVAHRNPPKIVLMIVSLVLYPVTIIVWYTFFMWFLQKDDTDNAAFLLSVCLKQLEIANFIRQYDMGTNDIDELASIYATLYNDEGVLDEAVIDSLTTIYNNLRVD